MIEDLHAENSRQTELIVKHSIVAADRAIGRATK
jgi:hypothetical protein